MGKDMVPPALLSVLHFMEEVPAYFGNIHEICLFGPLASFMLPKVQFQRTAGALPWVRQKQPPDGCEWVEIGTWAAAEASSHAAVLPVC